MRISVFPLLYTENVLSIWFCKRLIWDCGVFSVCFVALLQWQLFIPIKQGSFLICLFTCVISLSSGLSLSCWGRCYPGSYARCAVCSGKGSKQVFKFFWIMLRSFCLETSKIRERSYQWSGGTINNNNKVKELEVAFKSQGWYEVSP